MRSVCTMIFFSFSFFIFFLLLKVCQFFHDYISRMRSRISSSLLGVNTMSHFSLPVSSNCAISSVSSSITRRFFSSIVSSQNNFVCMFYPLRSFPPSISNYPAIVGLLQVLYRPLFVLFRLKELLKIATCRAENNVKGAATKRECAPFASRTLPVPSAFPQLSHSYCVQSQIKTGLSSVAYLTTGKRWSATSPAISGGRGLACPN